MWCSQLRFPSFAVTPNGRIETTHKRIRWSHNDELQHVLFLSIPKKKKNTEFVIGQMRWEQLNFIMTESWIQLTKKKKKKNEPESNLCTTPMSHGFMVGSWKKTRHIFYMFALVIRIAIESTLCRPFTWTSRCVSRNAFFTLCTPIASKPSFTNCLCHRTIVRSTFQINWAVRKFTDNIWSHRCGEPAHGNNSGSEKKRTERDSLESRDFWRARIISV